MADCYKVESTSSTSSSSLLSNWRNAAASPILRERRVTSVPVFDALKGFGGLHKGGDDWCASLPPIVSSDHVPGPVRRLYPPKRPHVHTVATHAFCAAPPPQHPLVRQIAPAFAPRCGGFECGGRGVVG